MMRGGEMHGSAWIVGDVSEVCTNLVEMLLIEGLCFEYTLCIRIGIFASFGSAAFERSQLFQVCLRSCRWLIAIANYWDGIVEVDRESDWRFGAWKLE